MAVYHIDDHSLAKLIDFILNGEEQGPNGFVLVIVPDISEAFSEMDDVGVGVANSHMLSNLENHIALRVLAAVLRAASRDEEEN